VRFFRARSPGNTAREPDDRAPSPPAPDPGSPAPDPGSPAPDPGSPAPDPGSPAPDPAPPAADPGLGVTDPGSPDTAPGPAVTDPGLPGQLTAAFAEPPGRPDPAAVDALTLHDVTTYFAGQRPGDPRVKAGALLSVQHPDGGRQVFLVFLDAADRVCADASGAPYGRRVIARRFDDDLLDYLGGGGLLIFR
jgi:hypothetical protein